MIWPRTLKVTPQFRRYEAVGSYDSSVVPSGRRLEELKVTEGAQRTLAELPDASTPRTVKQLSTSTEEE